MSIVILNETGSANLESGALELDLQVPSGSGAVLEVRASNGPVPFQEQPPELHPGHGTKWVLPPSSVATTVVVRPTDEFFPAGTQVQLAVRNPADPSVLIMCPLVDVSELDEGVLCELEPTSRGLTMVRAVKMDSVEIDPSLTALAQATSFSSRRLARQHRIGTAARGLNLAIDVSASMVVHRDSGVLQTLCEAVLGVDRGMGDGGDVPAFAVGRSLWPLPPLSSESAPTFADVPNLRVPETGLRSVQVLTAGMIDGRDRLTLFITDAPPPDLPEFAAAAAAAKEQVRLVIIGPPPEPRTLTSFPGIAVVAPDLPRESLLTAPGHRLAVDRLVMDLVGPADLTSEETP